MMRTLGFAGLLPVFFRHPAAMLRDYSDLNRPTARQDMQ
jgi:hypothetical protein